MSAAMSERADDVLGALPLVLELARRQIAAYNRADLDAFCACYHPDVAVLDHTGAVTSSGMAAFRAGYQEMFAACVEVHAEVIDRVLMPPHVVEHERWSRVVRATGEVRSGVVLVRYTEQDERLRWVEFLK